MDIYAENVLDHYRHPHHKEELAVFDIEHAEKNLSCGDRVAVQLKIEKDRIVALGWMGEGCAISQAGMSMLSDELIGKSLAEADSWTQSKMLELLGVPVGQRRMKCALLGLLAVRNAIRAFKTEQPLGWIDIVEA